MAPIPSLGTLESLRTRGRFVSALRGIERAPGHDGSSGALRERAASGCSLEKISSRADSSRMRSLSPLRRALESFSPLSDADWAPVVQCAAWRKIAPGQHL